MRSGRPLSPEEAMTLEVMRTQAQERLARGGLSEAEEAALQLRAEGNLWADIREVEDRVEANREARRRQAEAEARKAAAETVHPPRPEHPVPASQEAAQPAPKPKRLRGRPQKNELWMADAAELYAQGYPLGRALKKLGITWASDAERRNIYRWKRFRELVERFRRNCRKM